MNTKEEFNQIIDQMENMDFNSEEELMHIIKLCNYFETDLLDLKVDNKEIVKEKIGRALYYLAILYKTNGMELTEDRDDLIGKLSTSYPLFCKSLINLISCYYSKNEQKLNQTLNILYYSIMDNLEFARIKEKDLFKHIK
jgi:hypothetical protein